MINSVQAKIYLSTHLSIYPSICLSVYLFIYLPIYLSIYVNICWIAVMKSPLLQPTCCLQHFELLPHVPLHHVFLIMVY